MTFDLWTDLILLKEVEHLHLLWRQVEGGRLGRRGRGVLHARAALPPLGGAARLRHLAVGELTELVHTARLRTNVGGHVV